MLLTKTVTLIAQLAHDARFAARWLYKHRLQ
jgi:hypothetical protein